MSANGPSRFDIIRAEVDQHKILATVICIFVPILIFLGIGKSSTYASVLQTAKDKSVMMVAFVISTLFAINLLSEWAFLYRVNADSNMSDDDMRKVGMWSNFTIGLILALFSFSLFCSEVGMCRDASSGLYRNTLGRVMFGRRRRKKKKC